MEGTSASYSPLQGWSNSKKYAFFAYYPLENQYVTLVNLGGTSYSAGVPAIKYTMSTTDPSASMVDVMTAPAHIDLDGNNPQVTNSDVTFNFQHRLSCLGLNIKNSSAGNITIKSVKFDITGIRYSSSILFFDGTSKPLPENGQAWSVEDISLDVSSESIIVPGANDGKGDELSDKLIFIPQASNISIRIKVDYTREADGYTAVDDTFSTTNLTTDLEEGKKHLVHMNFTDSTVDVTGQISSEGWVKIPDVTNSFN